MPRDPATVRRPAPVLPGLWGVLRGELTRWLGRRGLVHAVVWTALIQGILYVDTVVGTEMWKEWRGFDLLVHLWWITVPLVSIALAQNALIEERNDDTAPWVLSKPVSRSAYVVAKVAGTMIGIAVFGVVVQALLAFAWLPEVEPDVGLPIPRPDLGRYAAVVGVVALVALFFVAMTIFLTTFLPWRGPAAAIGLVVWIVVWTAPHEQIERLTIGGLIVGETRRPREMKPLAEYLVFETPLEPAGAVAWTLITATAFIVLGALVFRRHQF